MAEASNPANPGLASEVQADSRMEIHSRCGVAEFVGVGASHPVRVPSWYYHAATPQKFCSEREARERLIELSGLPADGPAMERSNVSYPKNVGQ